jgi:hypothetical protein
MQGGKSKSREMLIIGLLLMCFGIIGIGFGYLVVPIASLFVGLIWTIIVLIKGIFYER